MSVEDVRAFLQKAADDVTLAAAIHNAIDVNTLLKIAADAGFTFSAADITSFSLPTSGELSDSDLDHVAGGQASTGSFFQCLASMSKAKSEIQKELANNMR